MCGNSAVLGTEETTGHYRSAQLQEAERTGDNAMRYLNRCVLYTQTQLKELNVINKTAEAAIQLVGNLT